MQAFPSTNLFRRSGKVLKRWLAAGPAKAVQLLVEGMSARAQAITGTGPGEGLAARQSSTGEER